VPSKKTSRMKTEENKRANRVSSISKELELIKQRREEEKERSLLKEKEREVAEEKKHLYLSMINEKRIIEHGKSRELDVDYKVLQDFDSVKPLDRHYGLP
jgi:hypothetical protein